MDKKSELLLVGYVARILLTEALAAQKDKEGTEWVLDLTDKLEKVLVDDV